MAEQVPPTVHLRPGSLLLPRDKDPNRRFQHPIPQESTGSHQSQPYDNGAARDVLRIKVFVPGYTIYPAVRTDDSILC